MEKNNKEAKIEKRNLVVKQEELALGWFTSKSTDSHSIPFYDQIPKYPGVNKIVTTDFKAGDDVYTVRIIPAVMGENTLRGLSQREEMVENVLRYLAVQQYANQNIYEGEESGNKYVRVTVTIYQIYQELKRVGHTLSKDQIKESLEILSRSFIEVSLKDGKKLIYSAEPIISRVRGGYEEDDTTGERSVFSFEFHSLASEAIVKSKFYPVNYERFAPLSFLARYLTKRMNNAYRQAHYFSLMSDGFNMLYSTIVKESLYLKNKEIRKNIYTLEKALLEMAEADILDKKKPFIKDIRYKKTARRPAIDDVLYTFYPSEAFAREIINGNSTMKTIRMDQLKHAKRQS